MSSVALVVVVDGVRADLALVDALARLHLVARRLGGGLEVRGAGPDLRALIELAGLADVLLPVEAGGEAEGGEQVRVEEVVEPGDPLA